MGLELEVTNDIIPKFFQGQMIKGKLKIENTDLKRVKKAIIQLYGVENLRWDVAKWDEISHNTSTISENIKKEIRYDEGIKNNDTITFEVEVPRNAKRSYLGKFSEYYWLLETKIDISGRPDIHAKRIIQVI